MPRERISMRKLKDVFRMNWASGLSHRQIARSLSLGLGTVGGYVGRAEKAGLRWKLIEPMSNEELEAALFAKSRVGTSVGLAIPDCRYSWFCQQFRRGGEQNKSISQ